MSPRTGVSAKVEHVVAPGDTAKAMGSGTVEVLDAPRLIALCEQAAMDAVADSLEDTETSVGLSIKLDHLHPCKVGDTVVAEATLDKVEGRRLRFNVSAKDQRGLLAAGKITRVIVDTERFMEKAQ